MNSFDQSRKRSCSKATTSGGARSTKLGLANLLVPFSISFASLPISRCNLAVSSALLIKPAIGIKISNSPTSAVADSGPGYAGGALIFGAALLVLVLLYYATSISRVALFWGAFILTRPLGATVGDFLDKPVAKGGLEFSRPLASVVLAVAIIVLVLLIPQRAGQHPGGAATA